MRVHELIEILRKMKPNAEIIVGSHTLVHMEGKCNDPIGVWPAIGVDIGNFVEGGPVGNDDWVKIVASDAWGCTFVESQGIKRFSPVVRIETVRGVPADMDNDPEWHTRHLSSCGTTFRGCDPECPKELAERLHEMKDERD
jgi:hypothetical protein